MSKTRFFHSCVGVFQGGGCRAAALVGAYQEAISRGVQFTEFAGTSAGSIVAALIGAGATPSQLEKFVRDLDFRKFLSPPEITKRPPWYSCFAPKKYSTYVDLIFHQGFHSSIEIEKWMESCLTELLGPHQGPIPFSELPYSTSIVATDILSRKARIWNKTSTPNDSIAKAVRASCSIPLFFQPVDQQFVDGGALSNLPSFVFSDNATGRPLTSKILAFVLKGDPETIVSWGTKSYLEAVANTIVDGAQELQQNLQAEVHAIEIPTSSIKATDFNTITKSVLDKLINSGRDAASDFFDNELTNVRSHRASKRACRDKEDLYNNVTFHLNTPIDDVIISDFDTEFAYNIFPTLFLWRSRGTIIKAAVSKIEKKNDHGAYRKRLLRKLGVILVEHDVIPFRGIIINASKPRDGTAYIAIPSSTSASIEATIYEGSLHSTAIEALRDQLLRLFNPETLKIDSTLPKITSGSHDQLIKHLRKVTQYSKPGVTISVEPVPLGKLTALATFVHEYKYRQFEHWIPEFKKCGIELFESAQIQYSDNSHSIVTPPVVEQSGSEFVLIEGSTRAVYLRDQGETHITCVVIRNTSDPLPGKKSPFQHIRVMGRKMDPSVRYEDFDYSNFRKIEEATHPLDSLK